MHPDVLLCGKRAHAACVLTTHFVQSFAPQVEAATAVADDCTEADGIRPQTIRGYYSRTVTWMESITKLANPRDLQAVSAGARSLFEIQVDLVLLHYAPDEHPAQQVFDWERSAIFKQAEKVQRFFENKELPAHYAGHPDFLTGGEVPIIQAARTRWWNGRHPQTGRWTGRTLEQDARRAHGLFAHARLAEFYELEYAPTCWGTHGSGHAGLRARTPDLVAASCAQQLITAQRFALLNTRVVLQELGCFLQVGFDDFERDLGQRLAAIQLDENETMT